MDGMGMMLKNMLGIDPNEMKGQVEEMLNKANQAFETVMVKLNTVEQNQITLYRLMLDAGLISSIEDYRLKIEGKIDGNGNDSRPN